MPRCSGSGDASAQILGVSDDGRYAIFSSSATNLIQGQIDIPGMQDLFWTDLLTSQVKLVTNMPTTSIDSTTNTTSYLYDGKTTYARALPGADAFSQAVISGNGQFVAFSSVVDASTVDSLYMTKSESPNSTDITRTAAPDRGTSTLDVFRWSAQTGDTKLASPDARQPEQRQPDGRADEPEHRLRPPYRFDRPGHLDDGTRVSFVSSFNAQDALPQRVIPVPAAPVRRITNGAENLVFDNGDELKTSS